jgi:hypothetical protein
MSFNYSNVANAIKTMYHPEGSILYIGEWRAMMYVFDNKMILAVEKMDTQTVLYTMYVYEDSFSAYKISSNALFEMDDVVCGCTHVGNTVMLQNLLQAFNDNLATVPEFKAFFMEFIMTMSSSSSSSSF